MKQLLLWLALLCIQHPGSVYAGIEDAFVSLPLEFGLAAPARLVFNQRDLSACLRDSTAQECVLKGEKQNTLYWQGIQAGRAHSTSCCCLLCQSFLCSPSLLCRPHQDRPRQLA
jgi:hypothetical protein